MHNEFCGIPIPKVALLLFGANFLGRAVEQGGGEFAGYLGSLGVFASEVRGGGEQKFRLIQGGVWGRRLSRMEGRSVGISGVGD